MPVTLKITSTKPANTQFFGEVSEQNSQMLKTFNEQIRVLPGCVSNAMEVVDNNTRIFTIVFDTVENYANYHEIRTSKLGWAERQEYNLVNGIVSEITETIN
jgi:hypothetical protein